MAQHESKMCDSPMKNPSVRYAYNADKELCLVQRYGVVGESILRSTRFTKNLVLSSFVVTEIMAFSTIFCQAEKIRYLSS